jgi:hypothetical protein
MTLLLSDTVLGQLYSSLVCGAFPDNIFFFVLEPLEALAEPSPL